MNTKIQTRRMNHTDLAHAFKQMSDTLFEMAEYENADNIKGSIFELGRQTLSHFESPEFEISIDFTFKEGVAV